MYFQSFLTELQDDSESQYQQSLTPALVHDLGVLYEDLEDDELDPFPYATTKVYDH